MNTPSRLFVRCGACRDRTAIVVGRDGQEVRQCFSCGRRRSIRDEVHDRDVATSLVLSERAKVAA